MIHIIHVIPISLQSSDSIASIVLELVSNVIDDFIEYLFYIVWILKWCIFSFVKIIKNYTF